MVRIDFTRLRFLVIDDSDHLRQILRTIIHGFGARVILEAEDGALRIFKFVGFEEARWAVAQEPAPPAPAEAASQIEAQ